MDCSITQRMSDVVLDMMSCAFTDTFGLRCSHSFAFHAAFASTFLRRSFANSAQERTAASAKFGASMLILGSWQNSQFCGLNFLSSHQILSWFRRTCFITTRITLHIGSLRAMDTTQRMFIVGQPLRQSGQVFRRFLVQSWQLPGTGQELQ